MAEQRVDKMADWKVGGKAALLAGWLVAELAVMKAVMMVCLWVDLKAEKRAAMTAEL